ncbi:hypothetical protein WN51_10511 [Melipona quadrifasciata]|uniref:Uncharacterized protein n=1 Tax=Melipona quadrifasciata TaxID=166423 RepID=A0A0N1ISZ7_9HYME|nr:hypothetical protein WN51_10511 [Melipona quadrifasciata]
MVWSVHIGAREHGGVRAPGDVPAAAGGEAGPPKVVCGGEHSTAARTGPKTDGETTGEGIGLSLVVVVMVAVVSVTTTGDSLVVAGDSPLTTSANVVDGVAGGGVGQLLAGAGGGVAVVGVFAGVVRPEVPGGVLTLRRGVFLAPGDLLVPGGVLLDPGVLRAPGDDLLPGGECLELREGELGVLTLEPAPRVRRRVTGGDAEPVCTAAALAVFEDGAARVAQGLTALGFVGAVLGFVPGRVEVVADFPVEALPEVGAPVDPGGVAALPDEILEIAAARAVRFGEALFLLGGAVGVGGPGVARDTVTPSFVSTAPPEAGNAADGSPDELHTATDGLTLDVRRELCRAWVRSSRLPRTYFQKHGH